MTETFLTLHGSVVYNMLCERSTADRLEQNIITGFPKTKRRQHITNTVNVDSIEYIPYVGTKMLHVRSKTGEHQQAIQFNNVTFVLPSEDSPSFTASDNGQEYHIEPIRLQQSNVRVRCSCLDFRFRFASYNSGDQSLVGRPPPRYTPTSNRPPVNPHHVPGMCKHILRVISDMEEAGLVV